MRSAEKLHIPMTRRRGSRRSRRLRSSWRRIWRPGRTSRRAPDQHEAAGNEAGNGRNGMRRKTADHSDFLHLPAAFPPVSRPARSCATIAGALSIVFWTIAAATFWKGTFTTEELATLTTSTTTLTAALFAYLMPNTGYVNSRTLSSLVDHPAEGSGEGANRRSPEAADRAGKIRCRGPELAQVSLRSHQNHTRSTS